MTFSNKECSLRCWVAFNGAGGIIGVEKVWQGVSIDPLGGALLTDGGGCDVHALCPFEFTTF